MLLLVLSVAALSPPGPHVTDVAAGGHGQGTGRSPSLRAKASAHSGAAPGSTWSGVAAAAALATLAVLPVGYHLFRAKVGLEGGALFWGSGWFCCTIAMNVANKQAVGGSPACVAAAQMAFSTLVLLLCWPALRFKAIADLRLLLPWLLVCVFFALLLVSSLVGFQKESLATIIMFGSLRPLYAHVIEYGCFGEQPTRTQLGGLALIVLGSLCYFHAPSSAESSRTMNSVTLVGALALIANGLAASVDRCYQRWQLFHQNIEASRAALVLTMNFGALVLLLLALPLWAGELAPAAARFERMARGEDPADLGWVLLSCVAGLGIGFAGIGFQKVVSASEFLVWSTGSKAVLLCVEQILFQRVSVLSNLAALVSLVVVAYGTLFHAGFGHSPRADCAV